MKPILVGADPELFLMNKNQKLISAIGRFGGTKQWPKPIGDGCFVQEDNVAVEFNIPPAASKDAFVTSINFALQKLEERAKELNLSLAIRASAKFDRDQLANPKASVFGCDPDHNAWTLKENDSPRCADKSLRSAGGHVHVGCTEYESWHIARAMDLYLGVPSIGLDPDLDRRQLYGKAGAFRTKNYGMEYRTLSNFWLTSDKFKMWVYSQTMEALKFLALGNRLEPTDGEEIQYCINNSDIPLMKGLVDRYGLESAI